MKGKPEAFLFINGNAAFFDEDEAQIPEFQKYGWSGLHLFHAKYPNAFANILHVELDGYLIEFILKNIIHPNDRVLNDY